jgi:hypothetical protein
MFDVSLRRAIVLVVLLVVPAAGCVSLTQGQQKVLDELRALAHATASAYGLEPPVVLPARLPPGVGARYRHRGTGQLVVESAMLAEHPMRLALIGHELGHYVLGHEGADSDPERQVLAEHDANAKAVEILARVTPLGEAAALRLMHAYLLQAHRQGLLLAGHAAPCDEIRELFSRFPQHREWTASLECVGPVTGEQDRAPDRR